VVNIFNSNVFIEIGEAIGNVKSKVYRRRRDTGAVEQAFRKWLADSPRLKLPRVDCALDYPDDMTIEGTFRLLADEEEES